MPLIEWQRCYGGSDFEHFGADYVQTGHTLVETIDGYAFLAGTSSNDSNVHGNHAPFPRTTSDLWLVRTDLAGRIIWQKCLGGSEQEVPQCLIHTSDGGYLVCGETYSHDGDVTEPYPDSVVVNPYPFYDRKSEGWIVKLDSIGAIQWARCVGSHTGNEYLCSVIEVADGFVAVGASFGLEEGWAKHVADPSDRYNVWTYDALVVKLDTKGNMVYHRLLGGTKGDAAISVVAASDGYCFVGGTSSTDFDVSGNGTRYYGDTWVVRLDDAGQIRWQKCYGGTKAEGASCIINTPSGYMICGWTMSTDGDVTGTRGGRHPWIFTIDTNGTLLSQRVFGGSNDTDNISSIIALSDGNYAFAGCALSTDGDVTGLHRGPVGTPDSTDGWVGQFTLDLRLIWQKCLGGRGNDEVVSVIETNDGGLLLNGVTETMDNGDVLGNHPGPGFLPQYPNRVSDVWNVKLRDPNSEVAQKHESETFGLYPNPPSTILHVDASWQHVTLIDPLGRMQSVLPHNGTLDVSGLPAGVYYLENAAKDGRATRARFVKE